jgi:hypothetical protein
VNKPVHFKRNPYSRIICPSYNTIKNEAYTTTDEKKTTCKRCLKQLEKINKYLLKILNKIPSDIKQLYSISTHRGQLIITEPAFVNIRPPIQLKESRVTIGLENKQLTATLWKKTRSLHITVYDTKPGVV